MSFAQRSGSGGSLGFLLSIGFTSLCQFRFAVE